jgi:fluoroquinolone resistance protein
MAIFPLTENVICHIERNERSIHKPVLWLNACMDFSLSLEMTTLLRYAMPPWGINLRAIFIFTLMEIHDDKVFNGQSFAGQTTRGGEFNNCTFKKCDLKESEFAQAKFIDCVFEDCDLSMMKWDRSTLNNAVFKSCKILGVNFSQCADFLFAVEFDACILDYSSFMGKKMLKTQFGKSSLKEANFTQVNLSGSVFNECDLSGAIFSQTDLTSVNFSAAYNFDIDPELNYMKKAIFSAGGLPGLLSKHQLKIV